MNITETPISKRQAHKHRLTILRREQIIAVKHLSSIRCQIVEISEWIIMTVFTAWLCDNTTILGNRGIGKSSIGKSSIWKSGIGKQGHFDGYHTFYDIMIALNHCSEL